VLRTQTEISKLAKAAQSHNLDTGAYPFIGDAPNKKSGRNNANWHKNNEGDGDEGRLILFIAGGITHFEITSLQNLEK
jgi:hypothetical protein